MPRTVLIVDDEPLILLAAKLLVSSFGYRTLTANSGDRALALLRSIPHIGVLITDLRMPEMDGVELAERALQCRPQLHVIVSTACSREDAPPQYPYLAKPWLLRHVKAALAAAPLARPGPDATLPADQRPDSSHVR